MYPLLLKMSLSDDGLLGTYLRCIEFKRKRSFLLNIFFGDTCAGFFVFILFDFVVRIVDYSIISNIPLPDAGGYEQI